MGVKVMKQSLTSEIVQLITRERKQQTAEWGKQSHTSGFWLLILIKELGEASEELLEGYHVAAAKELIQAAAVITAWVEDILQRHNIDVELLSPPSGD
jgi:hypothetical protein